jgi:hypothetical protein
MLAYSTITTAAPALLLLQRQQQLRGLWGTFRQAAVFQLVRFHAPLQLQTLAGSAPAAATAAAAAASSVA